MTKAERLIVPHTPSSGHPPRCPPAVVPHPHSAGIVGEDEQWLLCLLPRFVSFWSLLDPGMREVPGSPGPCRTPHAHPHSTAQHSKQRQTYLAAAACTPSQNWERRNIAWRSFNFCCTFAATRTRCKHSTNWLNDNAVVGKDCLDRKWNSVTSLGVTCCSETQHVINQLNDSGITAGLLKSGPLARTRLRPCKHVSSSIPTRCGQLRRRCVLFQLGTCRASTPSCSAHHLP